MAELLFIEYEESNFFVSKFPSDMRTLIPF